MTSISSSLASPHADPAINSMASPLPDLAPTMDAALIEQLNHKPPCGTKQHKADPPAATHWIDMHGCNEGLFCTPCLNLLRKRFEDRMQLVGPLRCQFCGGHFATFAETYTVVAL